MTKKIPSGQVAFYVSPEDAEIRYSIVRVMGRYAQGFEVLELPRGDPDDFYVNKTLSEDSPYYRIVVEHSKEGMAVKKLGIKKEVNPLEYLAKIGYVYEKTETLSKAGARELAEEHGFDKDKYPDMAREVIAMEPFKVNCSYGSDTEYREFIRIEGDISRIELKRNDKTESKAKQSLGTPYVEQGGWASLREISKNITELAERASVTPGAAGEKSQGEARYQKSIVDWLETAEAALVSHLRKQNIFVRTSIEENRPNSEISADSAVSQQLNPGKTAGQGL